MPPTTDSFMYQTMHRQPADLRNLIENGWEQAAEAAEIIESARRVFVTGIGTSYHAALVGAWFIRATGKDARAVSSFDLAFYPESWTLHPDDAVVVMAHTGVKTYSKVALDRARRSRRRGRLGRKRRGRASGLAEDSAHHRAGKVGCLYLLPSLRHDRAGPACRAAWVRVECVRHPGLERALAGAARSGAGLARPAGRGETRCRPKPLPAGSTPPALDRTRPPRSKPSSRCGKPPMVGSMPGRRTVPARSADRGATGRSGRHDQCSRRGAGAHQRHRPGARSHRSRSLAGWSGRRGDLQTPPSSPCQTSRKSSRRCSRSCPCRCSPTKWQSSRISTRTPSAATTTCSRMRSAC